METKELEVVASTWSFALRVPRFTSYSSILSSIKALFTIAVPFQRINFLILQDVVMLSVLFDTALTLTVSYFPERVTVEEGRSIVTLDSAPVLFTVT